MVLETPMGSELTDVLRNGKISCCVREQLPNSKVLHQKPLVLMPTRTFPGTYGIELLWWHSVTNGLEDAHGVRAYGCTKKWEDFLLCTGTTAKIKVLHQKRLEFIPTRTFPGTYGIELLWWHFSNKRGPNVWICQEMGSFSCGVWAQLPKSKCFTKNIWNLSIQQHFLVHTVSNYYGGISVTTGSGGPHGVLTYGYARKWEDLPLVSGRNCQNRSVTPKTFYGNG